MTRNVVVLGSTGSIGTQALDVISANPGRFKVIALSAGGANVELLAKQAQDHDVPLIAVADETAATQLRELLPNRTIISGVTAASEAAALKCDVVLNGITGAIGLEPTLTALNSGNTLALANKESLIIGGELVKSVAKPGQIVPVDSEHSALAQALRGENPAEIKRLILTASGGPFRNSSRAQLRNVTPQEALAHPTWDMGPVVTTNSATLVNKGLEVIEAHLLFDIDFDRIEVVVHPGSIVHSMVEFVDGSTMLQASPPDMKIPIALALAWPERLPNVSAACDWSAPVAWNFEPLDGEAFPAVDIARRAGKIGRTAPAVFNAANEVCVDAFLNGEIGFLEIVDSVGHVVDDHISGGQIGSKELTLADVLAADSWARERTAEILKER